MNAGHAAQWITLQPSEGEVFSGLRGFENLSALMIVFQPTPELP